MGQEVVVTAFAVTNKNDRTKLEQSVLHRIGSGRSNGYSRLQHPQEGEGQWQPKVSAF